MHRVFYIYQIYVENEIKFRKKRVWEKGVQKAKLIGKSCESFKINYLEFEVNSK